MRALFLIVTALVFTASLAFAQAGPERTEKPKPKKTQAEKKSEEVKAEPEKTKISETKEEPVETSGHVKRAIFATAIEEREPVDSVDSLSTTSEMVYFFTEIIDLQDQTITHRWSHNGEVHAEVPIAIGGPRWRVYSSKKLIPALAGGWSVEVVDADGKILEKKHLMYYEAMGTE